MPITPPELLAAAIRTGEKPRCRAVICWRLPKRILEDVSLPVKATPIQPIRGEKNGNKKPVPAKGKGKAKASGEVKALYQDPGSGVTWSGRGRSPKWVTEICDKKGLSIEKFKASPDFRA